MDSLRVDSPRSELAACNSCVLTQAVRRGANGTNEPGSIAKLAGCDGDGSSVELGKYATDPLIQLGSHTDASAEHDEFQI